MTWYNVYDTMLREKNNYYCSKKTIKTLYKNHKRGETT